jgi:hypothetical protein
MSIPTPPVDLSGGIMLIRYSNGTYTHTMRFHLEAFGAAGSGPGFDRTYTSPRTGQTELSVNATWTGITTYLKPLWTAAWTFTIQGLYQVVGGVASQVFPTPGTAAVVGTSVGAEATLPEIETTLSNRTVNGGRFKLTLLAASGSGVIAPLIIVPNAAGSNIEKLCAYVESVNTGIVARDGTQPIGSFHETVCLNRRLRRHYGHA